MDRYDGFNLDETIADIDRRVELDPSDPDFIPPETAVEVISSMQEARYFDEVSPHRTDQVECRSHADDDFLWIVYDKLNRGELTIEEADEAWFTWRTHGTE